MTIKAINTIAMGFTLISSKNCKTKFSKGSININKVERKINIKQLANLAYLMQIYLPK